jgi:hypothetical protein
VQPARIPQGAPAINQGIDSMKYVFVVGCPRSGTTWLRMLLGQHPEVAATRETHLFDNYVYELQAAWDSAARRAVGLPAEITEDQFTTLCANFTRGVMQCIAEANPGAKVVVEKTPAHVRHVPLILKLLPEAYFIHLIRDPRAVVASLCAAGRTWGHSWASAVPVENARRWVRDVSAGREIGSLTDRNTTVTYEALLKPTGWQVLRELLNWMGLDADDDFCQRAIAECTIDRLRKKREEDLQSRGMARADAAAAFRKGKADSWGDELSMRDVEAIEYVAGDLMRQCGYTASTKASLGHRKPWSLKRDELLSGLERRASRVVALAFNKLRPRT